MHIKSLILPIFASLMACNSAYGKRNDSQYRNHINAEIHSPYTVELVDGRGQSLDTYDHVGRQYVLGETGRRYSIRVHNPTGRRVEAVVSVDGLDVIDGQDAGFHKRGYVIAPYGSVDIDGFRVSNQRVAAFRFSSVQNSYAGRKGKDRHVGVIGVAIFEEQHRRRPIRPIVPRPHRHYEYDHAIHESEAAPPSSADSASGAKSQPHRSAKKNRRPGLGTEFGERQYSATTSTRFIRAHHRRPRLLTEIRYNNADGLAALGIDLNPYPSDLYTRETANPFPVDRRRYSQPPPR